MISMANWYNTDSPLKLYFSESSLHEKQCRFYTVPQVFCDLFVTFVKTFVSFVVKKKESMVSTENRYNTSSPLKSCFLLTTGDTKTAQRSQKTDSTVQYQIAICSMHLSVSLSDKISVIRAFSVHQRFRQQTFHKHVFNGKLV